MFQSQSFTVVDQSDGFNVLPQLRENETKSMSVERRQEETRGDMTRGNKRGRRDWRK